MTQPTPADATSSMAYLIDAVQRHFLVLQTLIERGNQYLACDAHDDAGALKFDFERIQDGRGLAQRCNYALLALKPPANQPIDPLARPVVVVDPRAGNGPGIGGFKPDSEVGMAMRAGHAVYFMTFSPEPVPGQTLDHVLAAQAQFLATVIARHPKCNARPVVIGNCQAGWAMMIVAAQHPDRFGPLMLMGAPLAYWSGASTLNPMRYAGGLTGGSWLTSLMADLSGDRFDGVHFVDNFERLDPAQALVDKPYQLWQNIDTEAQRYLDFERWWGHFFQLTGAEVEAIAEQLFIGNALMLGHFKAGGEPIDLRAVTAPVLVFASWGDPITPPPQALNWIIDTWGDERAIAAAGRTIVYVLHENAGHLGLFVGGAVARKEHDQLVSSLDVIESLPPGLYEMKLQSKDGPAPLRWDTLEPGSFSVHFEHRSMADLLALNPEGRDEEALFSTVAQVSARNASLYKTWIRPWLAALSARPWADALAQWQPLRLQRALLSDAWPLAPWIRVGAGLARAHRASVPNNHPLRQLERQWAQQLHDAIDFWRQQRDAWVVQTTRSLYGTTGLGAWFKPEPATALAAQTWAKEMLAAQREAVLARVNEGGFAEAVCRIVLAGMASVGAFERRSLRLAQLLTHLPSGIPPLLPTPIDWRATLKSQAQITAVAPVEALNALPFLLVDDASGEAALALSAAVMMIEPTLNNPRSEIIEFVMDALGANPQRVMALARALTEALDAKGSL